MVMVGPEGQDFQQKLKDLAAGSPTHIRRMFSYGPAAPQTKRRDEPFSRTKYSSRTLNGNPPILNDSGDGPLSLTRD